MFAHEPHCPIPRAESRGEVAVCQCIHRREKHIPKIRYCHFSRYGSGGIGSMTLEEMINLNLETGGDLWARRESSGSESCYVEIARWSHKREQWERFAFEKMLDVEFLDDDGDPIEMHGDEKADRLVKLINTTTDFSFIHSLPDYED